jgi:hypothetical protein
MFGEEIYGITYQISHFSLRALQNSVTTKQTNGHYYKKGKITPLQARCGPEGG